MLGSHQWSIRITHLPTGISVTRTSDHFRQQWQARDSAMKYLRSRVYMSGHPPIREDDLKIEPVNQQPAGQNEEIIK